jgi:hypothetical protein
MSLLCITILCHTIDASAQRRTTNKKEPVIAKVDSTEIVLTQTKGAPVAPFIDTLFLIHGGVGSFTVRVHTKFGNFRTSVYLHLLTMYG